MELQGKSCVPCRGGMVSLSEGEVVKYLEKLPGWEANDDFTAIYKSYKFQNYADAFDYVSRVSEIAEAEGHHPDISFGWGYCDINLFTHAVGGLHENDFIVAAKINALKKS